MKTIKNCRTNLNTSRRQRRALDTVKISSFTSKYVASEPLCLYDVMQICKFSAAKTSTFFLDNYRLQLYHADPWGSHGPRQTQQKSIRQFWFRQRTWLQPPSFWIGTKHFGHSFVLAASQFDVSESSLHCGRKQQSSHLENAPAYIHVNWSIGRSSHVLYIRCIVYIYNQLLYDSLKTVYPCLSG